LANYYSELDDLKQSVQLSVEALNISERIYGKRHPEYATSLDNLAWRCSESGDYSEALRLATEALNIREELCGKMDPIYALSLNNLAIYNSHLGNYVEAIRLGTEALNIREKLYGTMHPDYATSASNLAIYEAELGNYGKAIHFNTIALHVRGKLYGKDNLSYASSLNDLAFLNYRFRNYDEAIRLGTESLKIIEKISEKNGLTYALFLNNLSAYNHACSNYTESIRFGTEALNIREKLLGKEHPDYAVSLNNLALTNLYSGNVEKGLQYEVQYCNLLIDLICQSFSGLATDERAIYWDKYKVTFLSDLPSFAYKYNSQQFLSTAYSGLLFGKGLLLNATNELLQNIMGNDNTEANHIIGDLRANRHKLNQQLDRLVSKRILSTDSLNKVISGLEHKLLTISKEYGDYTKNLRIDVKDVQAKLTKNDIAVEFASFEVNDTTIYCAYLLKPEYESPKMKVCLKQTDQDVFADAYSKTDLSKAIWGTLADELVGVKNIYFAPSGELYNIAIESLPDWEDSTKLVSDRWNFYRLSSTRELALIKDKNQIKKSVVYGGLKYDTDTATIVRDSKKYGPRDFTAFSSSIADSLNLRNGVVDLPGTKIEANAIDSKLRAVNIDDIVRTDTIGTEASFKSLSGQKKNLLHIATHGFYWTETEAKNAANLSFLLGNDEKRYQEDKALTRSGLLFAGANNALKGQPLPDGVDDGILTAQEISQLDLRGLDLVVLSACETGLGEITGDGVFGLQRGFKKAGAQSIMMSLWKVDDEATQMLMTQFYTNLTSGKSKRQSLLDAQRYLREYEVEETVATNGNLTPFQKKQLEKQGKSIEQKTETRKIRPYSDPRYWAAFILLDAID
jgi:CHAT domain-containing protein